MNTQVAANASSTATKPAHTPTPWAFRKNGTRLIIDGPNSRMVAETLEYVPSEGEAKANAALIAAAPELLAALQLVHANAGESPEWIRERIEPVISKALNGSA